MNNPLPQSQRILALSFSSRGIGFAVLERPGPLIDWGVKPVKGEKNKQCLKKATGLIRDYQPEMIILEDALAKDSRRSTRIRILTRKIIALSKNNKIQVATYSQTQIKAAFFADAQGTKQELAEIVGQHFPEELMHLLPPKRRDWESEHSRMGIFDAVALALFFSSGKD